MAETLNKAPERAIDSIRKMSESKGFTDDNAMGGLKLSEIRGLQGQSKKIGEELSAVTDDKSLIISPVEKAVGEKLSAKEGPWTDTGAKNGMIGIPEDAPAFKAYERFNPKIESAFPGDDETSQELRRAALTYVMDKQGFGDKLKPEQLELLKNTPGALDKLDKMSFDDKFPIHLNVSKVPLHLDMGRVSDLYQKK